MSIYDKHECKTLGLYTKPSTTKGAVCRLCGYGKTYRPFVTNCEKCNPSKVAPTSSKASNSLDVVIVVDGTKVYETASYNNFIVNQPNLIGVVGKIYIAGKLTFAGKLPAKLATQVTSSGSKRVWKAGNSKPTVDKDVAYLRSLAKK